MAFGFEKFGKNFRDLRESVSESEVESSADEFDKLKKIERSEMSEKFQVEQCVESLLAPWTRSIDSMLGGLLNNYDPDVMVPVYDGIKTSILKYAENVDFSKKNQRGEFFESIHEYMGVFKEYVEVQARCHHGEFVKGGRRSSGFVPSPLLAFKMPYFVAGVAITGASLVSKSNRVDDSSVEDGFLGFPLKSKLVDLSFAQDQAHSLIKSYLPFNFTVKSNRAVREIYFGVKSVLEVDKGKLTEENLVKFLNKLFHLMEVSNFKGVNEKEAENIVRTLSNFLDSLSS